MRYIHHCTNRDDLILRIRQNRVEKPYVAIIGETLDFDTENIIEFQVPDIPPGNGEE